MEDGSGLSGLFQKAKEQAGSLAEKAIAIDDYIGSWEDKVETLATDKIQALVVNRDEDVDEIDDPNDTVEERLIKERRKTRELKSQLGLQKRKMAELERAVVERDAATAVTQSQLAARDETILIIDAKINEYAELIPKWEAKMKGEDETKAKEQHQQMEREIRRVQSLCDERVAELARELELERSNKSSLEFKLSQTFEARARAQDASAEMVDAELSRLQALVPAHQAQIRRLETSLNGLREREQEQASAVIAADQFVATSRQELKDAEFLRKRDAEVRQQLQRLVDETRERSMRQKKESEAAAASKMAEVAELKQTLGILRRVEQNCASETDDSTGLVRPVEGVERVLMQELQGSKQNIVTLRVHVSERENQLRAISDGWRKAKEVLATQATLITALEEQLSNIGNSKQSSAAPAGLTASTRLDQGADPAGSQLIDVR
jgi:chromosome segregation ATPase